jgi:hypothetical protein
MERRRGALGESVGKAGTHEYEAELERLDFLRDRLAVTEAEYRSARDRLASLHRKPAVSGSSSTLFRAAMAALVASLAVALLGYSLDPGLKHLLWPQLGLGLVLLAMGLRLAAHLTRQP